MDRYWHQLALPRWKKLTKLLNVWRTRGKEQAERKLLYKFLPEQQAAVSKYASLHCNQAPIQHFSKQLGVIFSSACRVLANGCVLIGQLFEAAACACARAVDHAKFKATKIYSLKAFWSIIRKFAKLSRYTVPGFTIFPFHKQSINHISLKNRPRCLTCLS